MVLAQSRAVEFTPGATLLELPLRTVVHILELFTKSVHSLWMACGISARVPRQKVASERVAQILCAIPWTVAWKRQMAAAAGLEGDGSCQDEIVRRLDAYTTASRLRVTKRAS